MADPMANKPIKYEIRTWADMLKVPANKRSAMLDDLEIWLSLLDFKTEIDEYASKLVKTKVEMNGDVFTWVDDGLTGLSGINLTDQAEKPLAHINFKQEA